MLVLYKRRRERDSGGWYRAGDDGEHNVDDAYGVAAASFLVATLPLHPGWWYRMDVVGRAAAAAVALVAAGVLVDAGVAVAALLLAALASLPPSLAALASSSLRLLVKCAWCCAGVGFGG
ncbi:hypothetical protein PLICRDRAFT_176518 [Plicaturopsis crispa FD-325 SS-3]|nr:hypothetical protein PLICRDRAFT_176518 [Plicaturopsis crispa FD-325 SS-3]